MDSVYFTRVYRPRLSTLYFYAVEALENNGEKAYAEAKKIIRQWQHGKITYKQALNKIKKLAKQKSR